MRVWLVQRAEPTPHDNEGTQRLMRMGILSQLLDDAGHEVVWWTSDFDHYNRRHRYGDDRRVPVGKRSSIQYLKSIGYGNSISPRRLLDNGRLAKRFAEVASRDPEPPDVILASIPTAELARESVRYGLEKKIPVVLDIRDLWPDIIYELLPALLRPFARILMTPSTRALAWAVEHATAVTGLTEPFVDWGVAWGKRQRGEWDRVFPMAYVHKPLEATRLDEASRFWDELGVVRDDETITVAFFGKLGRLFHGEPVVEAARLIEAQGGGVRFVICGSGRLLPKLQAATKALSNVVLPGWVSEAHIRVLMERSDLGLASYVQSENFEKNIGNKPAEYLAGGLPIALNLGSGVLFDLLGEHGCGFSYGHDPRELATRLLELQQDRPALASMSKKARETFDEIFDGKKVYADLIRYLEDLSRR